MRRQWTFAKTLEHLPSRTRFCCSASPALAFKGRRPYGMVAALASSHSWLTPLLQGRRALTVKTLRKAYMVLTGLRAVHPYGKGQVRPGHGTVGHTGWVPAALQAKPLSDALLRRLQLHVSSSFDTRLQRLQLHLTLRGGHVLRKGGAAVAAAARLRRTRGACRLRRATPTASCNSRQCWRGSKRACARPCDCQRL